MIATRLRLLLTSDIHARVDMIHRLHVHLLEIKFKPDVVICTGDLLNVDNNLQTLLETLPSSTPQQNQQSSSNSSQTRLFSEIKTSLQSLRKKELTKNLQSVLSALKNVNSKTRVVYIPGNHDPPDLFRDVMEEDTANEKKDNQPSEVELAVKELGVNLHQRVIRIAPNLVLAGLGGSVPTTVPSTAETTIFREYPYTETDYARHVNKLLTDTKVESDKSLYHPIPNIPESRTNTQESDQLILLTHNGPAHSSTTIEPLPNTVRAPTPNVNEMETGSYSLTTILQQKELSQRALLHIHGHAHYAQGVVTNKSAWTILNPGPLRDGKYGLVTLVMKRDLSGMLSWRVESVSVGSCV